jgi:DNA-binding NarL/FixJ family response regulator
MMKTIRILLVDDHTLVRAGIRGLLQALPGLEVVGEAANGQEAVRLAEVERPDVMLLDIGLPGLNGLEVLAQVAGNDAAMRIIIVSMYSSEEYVYRAFRAGAAGYLLKEAAVSELEIAVRAVARGETYLSPAISKRVVANYLSGGGATASPLDTLTPRQREILQLVAEGLTSKEVAQRLGVSYRTVEAHRTQLMKRLDLHDLAGLVRFALRVGLIARDD